MATELARTLPAEELVSRNICPVKPDFVKKGPQTKTLVEAVGSAAGHASGEAPSVQKKSKRQERLEHNEKKKLNLCFHFVRGLCRFGDDCKFTHDVEAFVGRRDPELPGKCPFASQDECPFGIVCRWASTHTDPDAFTKEWLVDKKMINPLPESAVAMVELPVSESVEKPLNEMPRGVQEQLRRNRYDFSRTSSVLAELGIQSKLGRGGNKGPGKARAGAPAPEASATSAEDSKRAEAPQQAAKTDVGACSDAAQPAAADSHERACDAVAAERPMAAAAASTGDAADVAGSCFATPAERSTGSEPAERDACGDAGAAERPAKRVKISDAERSPVPVYDISKSTHVDSDMLAADGKKRLDFRGKLYLAPLTTNGNLPFRRVCKGLGVDITCGEMAMCTNLLQGQASEWALLKRHPCEDMFGVQICGGHADTVARCVQVLDETINVDFIDINMGCPIDLVCNKGAGSGLLLKPRRMEEIVRSAARVATCPLTFKTRTSFYERERIAHTIIPGAAEWGAAAVTLHGRTRQQRYSKTANWEYIEQVAAATPASLPVIGNGDVFSWEDYEAHMKSGKLATCMIARGALIKPWIFTEIKERRHWDISASERLDILKDFCRFGLEHWGSDTKGVENVRRFLLEWLSFLHRYVPVGLLEVVPQHMTWRPPAYFGRSDLETLFASDNAKDWVKISEMLLGPAPDGFVFQPKHKSNSYATTEAEVSQVYHG